MSAGLQIADRLFAKEELNLSGLRGIARQVPEERHTHIRERRRDTGLWIRRNESIRICKIEANEVDAQRVVERSRDVLGFRGSELRKIGVLELHGVRSRSRTETTRLLADRDSA